MHIAAFIRGVIRRGAAGLLLAAALAACAEIPTDPIERATFEQNNDPFEPMNREIFDFNLFVDRILLKPVAKFYVAAFPEQVRNILKRALDNMKEPVVAINNVLQAEPERAGITAGRFVVNSTLGFAGFFDVAGQWGLTRQSGDFGQTMFTWGLPQGPFLMAPILGPSNPRDLLGMVADSYMDPFSFLATAKDLDAMQISRFVLGGIDDRARVLDILASLEANSLDFYAQLRSLSQQRRAAELRHGAAPPQGGDLYQDPGKPAEPAVKPAAPSATRTTAPAVAAAKSRPRVHVASKTPGASDRGISITLRSASP